MSRQIPINDIVNSVLEGYEFAQKEYEEMSGGWWLWQAPEYFITSAIASKINRLNGAKYITLEHGSTDALRNAGAKGRGRLPKDVREKGKVDILLWWVNDSPRAIIEVKNQIYAKDQYIKDINRIKAFLVRNNGGSSLQFGIFSFYESAADGKRKPASDKISDRIQGIFDYSKSLLGNEFKATLHTSALNEELEENSWQAACILIKLKSSA